MPWEFTFIPASTAHLAQPHYRGFKTLAYWKDPGIANSETVKWQLSALNRQHYPISPTSSLPESQVFSWRFTSSRMSLVTLVLRVACLHAPQCPLLHLLGRLIPPAKLWNSFKANIYSLCSQYMWGCNRSLPHRCRLGQLIDSRCEVSRGLLVLAWLSLYSCAPTSN